MATSDNKKSLVIESKHPIAAGSVDKWEDAKALEDFITHIVTTNVNQNVTDVSKIVSGMPTIYARACLFGNAITYSKRQVGKELETPSNLIDYYNSLMSEWRGLIACLALNYQNVQVRKITLKYSDWNKDGIKNIYEPKGAFGKLLTNKWLWCTTKDKQEEDPFIYIIEYNKEVVAATSPECLLFTSASYKISNTKNEKYIKNGKFSDPTNNGLSASEKGKLYAYLQNIINNWSKFVESLNIPDNENVLRTHYVTIYEYIGAWGKEILKSDSEQSINSSNTPPVSCFESPFDTILNFKLELYGRNGSFITNNEDESWIKFDPEELLMPPESELANVEIGKVKDENGTYKESQLETLPVCLLEATIKNEDGSLGGKRYFTLPFTKKGLDVFGDTLEYILGIKSDHDKKTRINAICEDNIIHVTLQLYTANTTDLVYERVFNYGICKSQITDKDIILWPNFKSKYWRRYFVYSEFPYKVVDQDFRAVPYDYEGNELTEKNLLIQYPKDGGLNYKYEIYESANPIKWIKFISSNKECGYVSIRYAEGQGNNNLPQNCSDSYHNNLHKIRLGIDFGSTNTSVAYSDIDNGNSAEGLEFTNRRIPIFRIGDANKDAREIYNDENDLLFFQGTKIQSNAIKSMLTVHDLRCITGDLKDQTINLGKAVTGGFPCFEKMLPIEEILSGKNRIRLNIRNRSYVEIIQNMKWDKSEEDKANKKAFLAALILQLYAELFIEDKVPFNINWSYPSSMSMKLIASYEVIWDELTKDTDFCPVIDSDSNPYPLQAFSSNTKESEDTDIENNDLLPPNQEDMEKESENTSINDNESFNFQPLSTDVCLTEACAVANYINKNGTGPTSTDELTLCFDIGGSTTDISALCYVMHDGEKKTAMIKQSSIRFAAELVSRSTICSPKFYDVLKTTCKECNLEILGITSGENKYNDSTAQFFFEQIVDRLTKEQLPSFYMKIKSDCSEMMCADLYVTGLIVYYAGQITNKIVKKMRSSHDGMGSDWKPRLKVVFAGKGSRIFEWYSTTDYRNAKKFYDALFVQGIGGKSFAKDLMQINDLKIALNTESINDVKYEVSKGLALMPNKPLLVPRNNKAIEILGEEGFSLCDNGNEMSLHFDDDITPKMMKTIGVDFKATKGKGGCKKFIDFIYIFKNTARNCGLKMTDNEFESGYEDMDMNNYIQTQLPEWGKEMRACRNESREFDYVAPIIIIEGLKFYEDVLLKKFQNNR